MKKYCIICNQKREIVWSDYDYTDKWEINLCIDCLKKHMPEECKNLKECPKCKTYFTAKESWKRVCFDCWKKENPLKSTSKKYKINLSMPQEPGLLVALAPTTTI